MASSTSVLVPFLYLATVIAGLSIFSYFYRKRNSQKVLEPYFSSHPERDTYVTLIQQANPPASEALLKAALVRRAMADVQRILRIREDKPALQALLQKGAVGDDLWNSLLAAEKETEAEVLEVMHEANSFLNGWGQFIFSTAGEMLQNEKMRKILDEIPKMKAEAESKYSSRKKKAAADAPASAKENKTASSRSSSELPPEKAQLHTSNGSLAVPIMADAVISDSELSSTSTKKTAKKKGKKK